MYIKFLSFVKSVLVIVGNAWLLVRTWFSEGSLLCPFLFGLSYEESLVMQSSSGDKIFFGSLDML